MAKYWMAGVACILALLGLLYLQLLHEVYHFLDAM